jgi:hypothetical protein
MGLSGFSSLSIEENRLKNIKKRYEKTIKPETGDSLTKWATKILEDSITREEYLKSRFPNYSVIKVLDNGLVIDDSKNDTVVKVVINGNNIKCSDSGKESDSYILYATLHPGFKTSKND